MLAVKTKYDGKKIAVPDELRGLAPGEVILLVKCEKEKANERDEWTKLQEIKFSEVWDNEEDAIYDSM